MTYWYDRELQNTKYKDIYVKSTLKRHKIFDNTTVMDRHRTVSCNGKCHTTGLTIYNLFKRFHLPITANAH